MHGLTALDWLLIAVYLIGFFAISIVVALLIVAVVYIFSLGS